MPGSFPGQEPRPGGAARLEAQSSEGGLFGDIRNSGFIQGLNAGWEAINRPQADPNDPNYRPAYDPELSGLPYSQKQSRDPGYSLQVEEEAKPGEFGSQLAMNWNSGPSGDPKRGELLSPEDPNSELSGANKKRPPPFASFIGAVETDEAPAAAPARARQPSLQGTQPVRGRGGLFR